MTAFDRSVELNHHEIGRVSVLRRGSLRYDPSARVDVFIPNRREMRRVVEPVVEHVEVRVAREAFIDAVTRRQNQLIIDEHAGAGCRGRLGSKTLVWAEPVRIGE